VTLCYGLQPASNPGTDELKRRGKGRSWYSSFHNTYSATAAMFSQYCGTLRIA